MAIQVSSIAELQQVMMQQVKEAMQRTEYYVLAQTKTTIDKEVYNKYQPNTYYRTYYLRDSVDVVDRNSGRNYYSMTVGHQPQADWFSIGEHTIKYVPEIVTYGKYGTYIGYGLDQFGNMRYHNTTPNGAYSKPRPYMSKTVDTLKNRNKYLKHLANNIGGDVSVIG